MKLTVCLNCGFDIGHNTISIRIVLHSGMTKHVLNL
ncbi:hypothetical protein LTSERUB_3189, partial [Salmonella enterica subsp. enterica serovar Rubislaw str. A4-653]